MVEQDETEKRIKKKPEEKRRDEKENPLKSEEKGVEKQEGNKVN